MSATVRVGKLGAVLAVFSGIARIQNEETVRVVDIDDDSLLTPWPGNNIMAHSAACSIGWPATTEWVKHT